MERKWDDLSDEWTERAVWKPNDFVTVRIWSDTYVIASEASYGTSSGGEH